MKAFRRNAPPMMTSISTRSLTKVARTARFDPSPRFLVARVYRTGGKSGFSVLGFNPTRKTATSRCSSYVAILPQGMGFRLSDGSLTLTLRKVREFRM